MVFVEWFGFDVVHVVLIASLVYCALCCVVWWFWFWLWSILLVCYTCYLVIGLVWPAFAEFVV